MMDNNTYDVIIIGGSYSGLAAAMALGRALRKVLIIDDGKPCNRQTPRSHNFLTNDGKTPAEITALAHQQVSKYDTVNFYKGSAVKGNQSKKGFEIETETGERFAAKKLVFATGIKDILPEMEGAAECWGISLLHCPYCHGYEVRDQKTGIIANGEGGFDFIRLIFNWTKDLTLFTNGRSTLTAGQAGLLQQNKVQVVENEIKKLQHNKGCLQQIIFKDGSSSPVDAIYVHTQFEQHCHIPAELGCELTEDGYIKIDNVHETTIAGIYAIGDNSSRLRTVANAVSTGTFAGMGISKKMILEAFTA